MKKRGLLCVFPEGRLPKPGEEKPLPFKPGASYLSLAENAPIIPVYTNGKYFTMARAKVRIGTPIDAREYWDADVDEKTNLTRITDVIRQKVIELGKDVEGEQA